MSKLRRPKRRPMGPQDWLWTDEEAVTRPGESQLLKARMDMVTDDGLKQGVLLLTTERILYRLLDAPDQSEPALIVETLNNIRLGRPARDPLNEFVLVLRRDGAEIPLHLRTPEPNAPDDAVELMYRSLQRLLA